jgi:hypothetical protein
MNTASKKTSLKECDRVECPFCVLTYKSVQVCGVTVRDYNNKMTLANHKPLDEDVSQALINLVLNLKNVHKMKPHTTQGMDTDCFSVSVEHRAKGTFKVCFHARKLCSHFSVTNA